MKLTYNSLFHRHQFSKLQIYSVEVSNAILSLQDPKELFNDNANFVIMKGLLKLKLLYWGIHWSQKDQIRFPNLKGIICTPKLYNRKYRSVSVLNQELKTIVPFNLVHGLKYIKRAYSPLWLRDFMRSKRCAIQFWYSSCRSLLSVLY